LAEAGYPDGGFDMVLGYVSSLEDRKKTVELYKAELEKLGVNVEIIGMPWDQLWEKAKSTNPADRQDWLSFSWWPDMVSPASWFKALYQTEDSIFFNLGYYSNPELDELIEEADILSGTDREAAAEVYREAAEILAEDAVSTYVSDEKSIYIINNSLKNFGQDPAYPYVLFFYDFYRE
jgi:peptide/nickel transport system substrate-binding protein